MNRSQTLYRTPFSLAYWNDARKDFASLKMLVSAALLVAMTRALSLIPAIPMGSTKFTFGFLARALCALVGGPVVGLAFGFVEDILGFLLHPTGDFFIGYTISTMAGLFFYAVCFYRAKITVWRIVLANVLVNYLVNALMGSLWSTIVRHGTYWGWFAESVVKNTVTLPLKVVMLYIMFQALLPILQRMGLIPKQVEGPIRLI